MNDEIEIKDGYLRCPQCGDAFGLHIDSVAIAGRVKGEDSDKASLLIDHRAVVTPLSEPPDSWPDSSRRHAFGLNGWCEMCSATFSIHFTQHKGSTIIEVVDEPAYSQHPFVNKHDELPGAASDGVYGSFR